jgi:hypothetical protein
MFVKKILILAGVALVLSGSVALAAGDKNRGDEGEGPTVQECVNFDECPYGDESPQH